MSHNSRGGFFGMWGLMILALLIIIVEWFQNLFKNKD